MAIDNFRLIVSQSLRDKFTRIVLHTESHKPLVGLLIGLYRDNEILCLDCTNEKDYFIEGVFIIGAFCCYNTHPTEEPQTFCEALLDENSDSLYEEEAVILSIYKAANVGDVSSIPIEGILYSLASGGAIKVDVFVEPFNPFNRFVVLRANGQIPLTFEVGQDDNSKDKNVKAALDKHLATFSSKVITFHVKNSSILLTYQWEENSGNNMSCRELLNCIDYDQELGSKQKSRRKKHTKEMSVLNFDILIQTSGKPALEISAEHTLVIHHQRREFQSIAIELPIDVIVIAEESDMVFSLIDRLKSAVCRQLQLMTECLIKFERNFTYFTPVPYHFWPSCCSFPLTVVYPYGINDIHLEAYRKELHQAMFLPLDRPLLRRANQYSFATEQNSNSYLKNTHIGLQPSGVCDGLRALVDGSYIYYHYMQDNINDDGWGCAYRSLQTIVSWFILQGYTDRTVPTHQEIQQALVDIEDKEKSFVGSKQWIGSQELSFCLNHLLGITCKIMFVNSGTDLASKGREIANHFLTEGTPIMIGGGVLAHTLLGVDFNENTGDLKFLVLDPHYTGGEDLAVIQNKGWCGWKGQDFWDQNAFYNLCLPQRPQVI